MGGGDHITKHGTHISRDMRPGGGPISPMIWASRPYVTREMGPGGWGGGGAHFTTTQFRATSSHVANLIVVARRL